MPPATRNGLSIRSKIAIYSVAMTVAALALAFAISFSLFSTHFKRSVADNQYLTVSALAGQVDDRLGMALEQLAKVARGIAPADLTNPDKIQHLLDAETDARAFFSDGFHVIAADGRLIASSPFERAPRGTRYADREYVRQTLQRGRPYISNPYRARFPPYDAHIAFAVPIKDAAGATVGLLAGRHDLLKGSFLQNIATSGDLKSRYLYIFSRDRTLIVHPDRSRIMEQVKPGVNAGFERAITEGFEGSLENVNSHGVAGITSFKRLKNADWILASHASLGTMYTLLHHTESRVVAVFAVVGLLASLVMWIVLGRIMAPLQSVISHIGDMSGKVGAGRFLDDRLGGDLGMLAAAFNTLVIGFDAQQEVVQHLNQQMQQQKAFSDGLLDKAAVPIFVLDSQHRVIVWNSAMESLTGFQGADMLGTSDQWRPFYPQPRPVLTDVILSADESNIDSLYGEYRMSQHVLGGLQAEGWYDSVGGQRRYLFFEAAPLLDSSGNKVAAIETLLDITALKQAEEEQRTLSWAVEHNPSSIVITAPDGTIEYVNAKFCQLTGYSRAEALGQNPRVLKSGEMKPEGYAELWQIISHGGTWHGEFHNKKRDGQLYWELAAISPIMDDQGTIIHYLAVKEDITQRKQYEAELRASQEELQYKHDELNALFTQVENGKREWEDTMDSLAEMVLMCDQFGIVKRCNRTFATFSGLPYDQIVGADCMELLAGIGLGMTSYDGVTAQLDYDHGQRNFEMLSNELKQSGSSEIRGVVVTIHETTELRRMNTELQKASAELQQTQVQVYQQEKMASIGQLAAGVAHEINNPMGFISSNLSTLGKYLDKISAFEVATLEALQATGGQTTVAEIQALRKKMKIDFILGDISGLLEESRDGAERVRRIVQDLKSFSHVDEAECKPFSINECLISTLNMARNEIKYVADVEQVLDPELPLLTCYPQQLNQVFMNIFVNAAHAIEGHGTITVTSLHEDDAIVVRISDTGKGIAPENLTRIFEPFFTTKEVGKGTGLGLSISYDIIKKHGGSMTVDSQVGIGTTFTIRLPLNHPLTTAESADPER